MAKREYLYGSDTLNYDNYIKNLDHNVQLFLDNLDWNDELKKQFADTYKIYIDAFKQDTTGRFNTDALGTIFDKNGLLTSDNAMTTYYDNKGNTINSETYNSLKDKHKKKYKKFNANKQVARYFNDIAKAMAAKGSPESNKFNFKDHGFFTYWVKKINPAGGDFNLKPFVDKDELVNGKRSRVNRANYLADEIKLYRENLGDYDFSENVFETKENYLKALELFENSLRDGTFDANDAQAALAAGINQDFFNQFFTEYDEFKTEDLFKKEQAERDKEEALKKLNAWVDEEYKKYEANKHMLYFDETSGFNLGSALSDFTNADGSFNSQKWDGVFNVTDFEKYYVNNQFSPIKWGTEWLKNPFNSTTSETAKNLLAGLILNNQLPKITSGKLTGMYYFKDSYSEDMNRVLVYNPTSGKLFYTFVANVPDLWNEKVKNANVIDGAYSNSPASEFYIKLKLGGVVKNQFGGNLDKVFETKYKEDLQKRAKLAGKTENQQKAAERYINSDYKTGNNDAGFTQEEWLRLGSAAADLVSVGAAFAPGVGTLVSAGAGLTSTGANLWADITDDNVSGWEAAGNALFGLGMDVVGLIPGLGATGKTAKIVRTLTKLAPKVMTWLSAGYAAANAPAVMNSWSKLANDEKLTSEDWENIMQSLNFLLGGGAAVGRNQKAKGNISLDKKDYSSVVGKRINKKIQNEADWEATKVQRPQDDKVAILMRDSKGNEKRVVFEGEDAKRIREAESIDDVKKVTTEKYQDLKDFTIEETFLGIRSPLKGVNFLRGKNWQSPVSSGVKTYEVYERTVPLQGKKKPKTVTGTGKYNYTEDDKINLTPKKTWESVDDAFVESQIAPLRQASKDYETNLGNSSKRKAAIDKGISNIETKVAGRKSSELASEIADIRARYARDYNLTSKRNSQAQLKSINKQLSDIEDLEKDLKKISKELSKESTKNKPDANRIQTLQTRQQQLKKELIAQAGRGNSKKTALLDEKAKHLQKIDDYVQLEKEYASIKDKEIAKKEVENFEKILERLNERKAYWDAFKADGKSKARIQFENDYTVTDGNITFHDPKTNRDITRNYQELLKGIKFKKGGSILKFQNPAGPFKYPIKLGETLTKDPLFFPNLSLPSSADEYLALQAKFRKEHPLIHTILTQTQNTDSSTTLPFDLGSFDFKTPSFEITYGLPNFKKLRYPVLMEDGTWAWPVTSLTGHTTYKPIVTEPTETVVEEGDGNENDKKDTSFLNNLNRAFQNPDLLFTVPKALAAKRANNKMTELELSAEKPILNPRLELSPSVPEATLNKEIAASNKAAALSRLADNSITSDGRLQQALKFDAALQGLAMVNQGKQESDEAYLNNMLKIKAQRDIEDTKNLSLLKEDIQAQLATNKNIVTHKVANINKNLSIDDQTASIFEKSYRDKEELRESSYKESLKNALLTQATEGTLEGITASLKSLLTRYLAGDTNMEELEKAELNKALSIINSKVTQLFLASKGISYYNLPRYDKKLGKIVYDLKFKKGGTLKDDFNKIMLSSIKENNKKLDKLSKTMINYFKDIKKK